MRSDSRMNNLTKEKLEQYVKSNTDFYEKYRERFNNKKNFFSWNWSLFFFIPWLAYRKIWDYYIGYLLISIIYAVIFYKLLTAPRDISPIIMIIVGGLTQIFIITSLLTANNKVLKLAAENRYSNGESSWLIVSFATLLLMVPPAVAMTMYYPIYKTSIDKDTIFHISEDEKDMNQLLKEIESISDKNINSYGVYAQIGLRDRQDLISKVVCYDNLALLEAIERKNAKFNNSHLEKATRCEALNSVKFLLSKGTRANEDNYNIVQNVIVYESNIPLAKLLIENENNMSEGANAQILIEQAINLRDSKERKAFIEYLVDKNINIYDTRDEDNDNRSALYEAVIKSDANTTRLLLEKGANPNQRYSYGRTPLYKALHEANIEIMQLLLEHKAKVDLVMDNGKTVLDNAVQDKKLDKVKLLLKYNATVTAKTLDFAMKRGDDKLITLIGQQKIKEKLSKEAVGKLFATACESKNTNAIDVLLKQGYDINSSKRILYSGNVRKDSTIFAYVLSKGADVNVFEKDEDNGRNILHNIIGGLISGDEESNKVAWEKIKLVLKYGININHQDRPKRTALMWALSHGRDHKDVVEYLFDHADVDLTLLDERGESLLHYVLNMPSLAEKIIKKLKKEKQLKKMINHVNIDGSTPLHHAAAGNIKVIKMLLAAGANPNIIDKNGYTPIANVKTKDSYDLLKKTGNEISMKKAECSIFVEKMGQKKYQPSCLMVAKQEKTVNNISHYQFLGGDISGLLKTTYDSNKGVYSRIYAYANVGHGYVINKNIEKAKESYANFAKNYSYVGISIEKAETMIQSDFDIISKLYGNNFRKDAMTAWDAVRDTTLRDNTY